MEILEIDSYQLFFHPIHKRWAIKVHVKGASKADVIDNLTAEEFSAFVAMLESSPTAIDEKGWIMTKFKGNGTKSLIPERFEPFE